MSISIPEFTITSKQFFTNVTQRIEMRVHDGKLYVMAHENGAIVGGTLILDPLPPPPPPPSPTILFVYAFDGTLTNLDGTGDWGTPTGGTVAYTAGRNGRSALTTTNTYWQTYSLNGGTHFPRDTFSYSVWAKFDTTPDQNQYFTMMHNTTNGGIGMDKWRDSDGLHLMPPGDNQAHYPLQNGITFLPSVGQWQMYTFTTTHGGDVKFFCDGVLIYSYTPSWDNTGTQFVTPVTTYWGYNTDANCHYQDFIFYDGELSADDVSYIYNNQWNPA
jgi:hypothetical protein